MKSEEIDNSPIVNQTKWLKEIAYQLAVMNERNIQSINVHRVAKGRTIERIHFEKHLRDVWNEYLGDSLVCEYARSALQALEEKINETS